MKFYILSHGKSSWKVRLKKTEFDQMFLFCSSSRVADTRCTDDFSRKKAVFHGYARKGQTYSLPSTGPLSLSHTRCYGLPRLTWAIRHHRRGSTSRSRRPRKPLSPATANKNVWTREYSLRYKAKQSKIT